MHRPLGKDEYLTDSLKCAHWGGENGIHNFSFDFMPSPALTAKDCSLSEHTSDTHTGHSDGLLY